MTVEDDAPPGSMGVLLSSSAHLFADGDSAPILSVGTFALLSFFAMLEMEQRSRRGTDPKWRVFMDKPPMVPFSALLRGRLRFALADISLVSLIAGFTLYAAIYWLHGLVSGDIRFF